METGQKVWRITDHPYDEPLEELTITAVRPLTIKATTQPGGYEYTYHRALVYTDERGALVEVANRLRRDRDELDGLLASVGLRIAELRRER